jgi:LAGLIDADG endonuclease
MPCMKSMVSTKQKAHVYNDDRLFGHYLAGLWEGDGNINIKDKFSPKPSVHITMHKQQAFYVKKLLCILRRRCNNDPVGSVHIRRNNNSCVLNIFTPRGLKCMVDLIHDKLRTPKAYHLNLVVDWLNAHYKASLSPVSQYARLDMNTPWFAGFADADACFGIDLRLKPRLKVSCQFQINQRMQDPRSSLSYGPIFNSIAHVLGVKCHTLIEKSSGRYYYVVKASSLKSKQILRSYFDTYPLLTSKFLDYRAWCDVDDLLIKKNHIEHVTQILKLKQSMNQSRTKFTWSHLQCL